MVLEGAALATTAIEGGTVIEGAAIAEGVVEGVAATEGIANAVKQAGEIPTILEKVEPKEFPDLGEETTKVLEPDMSEIQEITLDAIEQSNIEKVATKIDETSQKLRELTEEEKQKLREENNLPENLLDAIRVDENGNYRVKCINEKYKDMENPDTSIRYVEKTITVNGVEITVVVPEFPSIFDVEIPPEIWEKGDAAIFKYCTEKLKEYLDANAEAKANFTHEQLDIIEKICSGQIRNPRIPGFTWHHSEIPGKIQLVDFKTHFDTRQTGGDFLWCGGIR